MKQAGLIIIPKETVSHGFSPLESVGELSALVRTVLTLEQAGVEELFLLVGEEDKALEKEVAFLGVTLLPLLQESESFVHLLQQGLAAVEILPQAVVVSTITTPLVTAGTVTALLGEKAPLVRPCVGGEAGFPLVVREEAYPWIEALERDSSFWKMVEEKATCVEVEDVGTVITSAAHASYQAVLEGHSLGRLRPEIKVRICREKPFLGPGTSQLLALIQQTGSMREACSRMGISYSKGWSMLRLIEQQLGQQVVERQQGGKKGGSARLTPEGVRLLEAFVAYEAACHRAAEELFLQHFGGFED